MNSENNSKFQKRFNHNNGPADFRMPKLRWYSNNMNNNFIDWKKYIINYAQEHFFELSEIFEDDTKYYSPPPVNIPMKPDNSGPITTEADDPLGILGENYKNEIRVRSNKIQQLQDLKMSMFAKIFNSLDDSALTIISCENAEYQIAIREKDPLKLWRLIKKTHIGNCGGINNSNISSGELKIMIDDQLRNCKMNENEQLSSYLRRFQHI